MEDVEVRAKARSDGSRDLWVQGWHLHCKRDAEPDVEKGEPDDAVPVVDDVKVEPFGTGIGVRCGRWIVVLGEGEPELIKAKTRKPTGGIRRFKRANR